MKKIFRFISLIAVIQLFIISNQSLNAQKIKPEEVPDDVIQTLDFENPGVKVSSWIKEGTTYIANFKEEGAIGKIYITNAGTWLKTTYDIPKNELPPAITDYVNENYPNFTITVSLLQQIPDVRTQYYIETRPEGVGEKSSVLTFNDMGKLIERKDPVGFIDPKVAAAQAEENKAAANASKTKPTSTTASKSTGGKEVAKQTSKPATTAKKPEATKTTSKPAPKTASKAPAKEEKTKAKKTKTVKPVEDEFGNVAINASTVPAVVTKALTKKVQRPEELNWFKIDSFYVAKCIAREQKNEIYISDKGVWVKTYIHLPEEAITGNMLKHISSFYKGYRFKAAVKELRADKQDKTMVEIYEKTNWKTKLVTTIIFDKTGKLIRTIDPDYNLDGTIDESEDQELDQYYEKMNMSIDENANKDIPAEVQNAFKAKYPRVTNVQWEKDDEENFKAIYYGTRGKEICLINAYGTLLETQTLGNPDNISANIKTYVKQECKGAKIIEYYAVKKLLDKKNYYKVLIQYKKSKDEQIIWFTTSGKVIEL